MSTSGPISIPPTLVAAQRAVDAAFAAIGAYGREVDRPALEWTGGQNARLGELWAETTRAATVLWEAVDASGLGAGDGWEFQRALKAAARESSGA